MYLTVTAWRKEEDGDDTAAEAGGVHACMHVLYMHAHRGNLIDLSFRRLPEGTKGNSNTDSQEKIKTRYRNTNRSRQK